MRYVPSLHLNRSWAAQQSEICQPLPCAPHRFASLCSSNCTRVGLNGVTPRFLERGILTPLSSNTEMITGVRDELRTRSATDPSYKVNIFFLSSLKSCASFPKGKKCQYMKEEDKLMQRSGCRARDFGNAEVRCLYQH